MAHPSVRELSLAACQNNYFRRYDICRGHVHEVLIIHFKFRVNYEIKINLILQIFYVSKVDSSILFEIKPLTHFHSRNSNRNPQHRGLRLFWARNIFYDTEFYDVEW